MEEDILVMCYLWVRVSADNDGDGPGTAVTQDRIDFVERHAVHRGVIDFHDLVTTPVKAHIGGRQQADQRGIQTLPSQESPSWPGCSMRPTNYTNK